MTNDGYAGPVWLTATTLPARAAYLIRAGSRKGFRRAAQEASTRWGGMAEPIIPVRKNGEIDAWWRQVIEISHIDGFVDIDCGAELAKIAVSKIFPQDASSVTPVADIDRYGQTKYSTHPAALRTEGYTQTPTIPIKGAPIWQIAIAGDITDQHEAHLGEGRVAFKRVPQADQVVKHSLHGQTALDATAKLFYENSAKNGPMATPTLLWITHRDSIKDALYFWNLRVLRSHNFDPAPMILLPDEQIEHWIHFPSLLSEHLVRRAEFSPDVVFNSFTVSNDDLDRIARNLGLRKSNAGIKVGRKWTSEMRKSPFTYRADIDVRRWFTFERKYGVPSEVEAHIANGRASLRFASPVAFRSEGGYTLLQIGSRLFDGLPRRDVVADRILRNSTWQRGTLQILTHCYNSYRLELQFPTSEEIVHLLVSKSAASYELSDKGRLGATILSDFDIELLLSPGVYEAIIRLTTPRSKELERELRRMRKDGSSDADLLELAARWGGRGARRYRGADDIDIPAASKTVEALETLCRMNWLERGFETDCARCGVRSFVKVDAVTNDAVCPACRAQSKYSRHKAGLRVQYRLNAFIDRVSDQGIIPHILAVAALRKISPHTSLLAGTNVTFCDKSEGEIDLLGIHAGKYVAGEVKTNAREFTEDQIRWDVEKSALLGVDAHIMACITPVSETTVEFARELAAASGMELISLSAADLRP